MYNRVSEYTRTIIKYKGHRDALKSYIIKMSRDSYLCSNLRGNLHIVRTEGKLQELSRVSTCHTNMNVICMSYIYKFKIFFFSHFQNCSLSCILIYFIPIHSLFNKMFSFSSGCVIHTHTPTYAHQKPGSCPFEASNQHPSHALRLI